MKHVFALAIVLASSAALADPQNVCVPRALGVPTREGPPKWLDWTGSGPIPADTRLDDPRWLGATGQSFALGSAKAPLLSRALISTDGATGVVKSYLYLSFIVDLSGFDTTPADSLRSTARDLFVGFHRPAGATGTDAGYLFQFHLTGLGSGVVAPPYCSQYSTCDESSATKKDFWRLFVDKRHTGASVCTGANGELYEPPLGAAAPISWMTTAAGTQDAVRYWKLTSDPSSLLLNRWAVQVRIPIVDPTGAASPIGDGIERGSRMFYEATAKLSGAGGGIYAKVGRFPDALAMVSVCPDNNTDTIVDEEMGDASAGCPACNVDNFAVLTDLGSPDPHPACPTGLDIDADHVGTVFNTPLPASPEAIIPSRTFGARNATTPNHVVALPKNTNPPAPVGPGLDPAANDINVPIQARFRLAGWGAAPWSVPGDTGRWKDIRGAAGGVCATPPAAGSADICGATRITPGNHGLITFDWTIGADPVIGASEYCEFGLTPPAGSGTCAPGHCSCADPADCAAGTGVQALQPDGITRLPCVPSIYQGDQCMLVELSSPNGAVKFVHQSIWSNMRFGALSTLAHDALIDARHLPTAPGQQLQDIYFVVMPRNMPRSVPPTTTSVALAQNAAIDVALRIAQPYVDDLDRVPPNDLERLIKRAGHATIAIRVPEGDDRLKKILRARQVMPAADVARVDALLGVALGRGTSQDRPSAALVENAVAALGSSTAAEVVPTLEIYPFYRHLGKGRTYEAMTSFSMFLSHESTLSGMRYEIDGADKVGENIYHMQIPVGFARKIQVRAQAVVGAEAALPPGNASWPCAGGCACGGGAQRRCGLLAVVGNTAPGLIAGVLVVRRRKKKPAKSAA